MFVHSTNGQVMEHDVSLLKETVPEEESPHDLSTDNSVAMDLTLEATHSDPNLLADTIIEQVHKRFFLLIVIYLD